MKNLFNHIGLLALIIDDDPKILKLLEFLLKKEGINTIRSYDGPHALEFLIEHKPDVILCDILMPEMNGMDVLLKIKEMEHLKNIPVIAVTALATTGQREKFLRHGFDAYFSKPINIMTFPSQVKGYIRTSPKEAFNHKQSPERKHPASESSEKESVMSKELAAVGGK